MSKLKLFLVAAMSVVGGVVAARPVTDGFLHSVPARATTLILPAGHPRPANLIRLPAGTDSGLAYRVGRSWGLMAGLHQVPTGQPLAADTSPAVRSSFTQPGLGVSYGVSPKLRFISGWHRGVGAYTVSPGNQFTVGISLR